MRHVESVVDTAIFPKKQEVPFGTLRSIHHQAHIELDYWERLDKLLFLDPPIWARYPWNSRAITRLRSPLCCFLAIARVENASSYI